MSREFKVPELGENVESATVAKVLVSKGDQVEKEQPVVELETDKAVAEVPCELSGKVEKVHVEEGDEVEVGQVLLTLAEGEAGGQAPEEAPEEEEKGEKEEKAEEREEGKKEAPPAEPEEEAEGKPQPERPEPRRAAEEPVPAAPSVRRFAREIGVELAQVKGSGPNGRISIEDVKAHSRSGAGERERAQTQAGATAAPELPDFSKWGETERKPMSKVRRLTAEQMTRAWSAIPHATQLGKADVGAIETLRRRYKSRAEQAGGHLSLTVVMLKTVAGALKAFPRFNASLDPRTNEIVYKKYTNIGVAMDTERGLVVPVIRNIERKSVIELAVELKELTRKARDGKLAVDDMQGGNFTITNAGALGGDAFIPIVNWPETAILGVARSRVEAVYENGEFRPHEMLPLALSYDHRLIDGADGVRFVQWVVEALEDPIKLAWEA